MTVMLVFNAEEKIGRNTKSQVTACSQYSSKTVENTII
jgi:hypothetical protein